MRNRRMFVLLTALAILVIGGGAWIYYYAFQTYHYLEVDNRKLYRDGFRSTREFVTAVGNANPRTIISLCDDEEYKNGVLVQEMDYISHTKLRFFRLAIPLGGYPTTKQVKEFLDRCESPFPDRVPVLVHCAQGIRRTGMMVAAYQMSVMGWSKEKAKEEIKPFGHSDRTINDIKRFIDVYDPIKREVTQDLPRGKESSYNKSAD